MIHRLVVWPNKGAVFLSPKFGDDYNRLGQPISFLGCDGEWIYYLQLPSFLAQSFTINSLNRQAFNFVTYCKHLQRRDAHLGLHHNLESEFRISCAVLIGYPMD